ncbi:MAG: ABC transporter ATP-binding protein [Oscillospiraceae bacterium]|nr:ABC transporter ATP-binding protein [Oscillospiraceae bacterium]
MLKNLSKSVRQYKLPAILTPITVGLEVVCEIAIPLVMSNLIDLGIDKGDISAVYKFGMLLLLGAVLQFAFGTLSGFFAAKASTGFASNLRADMFKKVQEYSFANIDKFSAASIVTRLTTDVSQVQMAFMMLTRMAFRSPLMLIFSLVVSFSIDAKISLVFLGVIPVLGLFLAFILTHAHPIMLTVFKTYDKLNGVVEENLRGMRVVKAFTREEYETEKFENISNRIYSLFLKAEKLITMNMPVMQFCVYSCMLLISWFGARAIVASGNNEALGLTTGLLFSLITYANQILFSLMILSMLFVMLTMARSAAERINEILIEEPDIADPADPVTEIADGSIVFENVSFRYNKDAEKQALKNVNLTIPGGKTVGIMGATGSAKSTLVQLIPRLYDATEGRVLVGGRDVREYSLTALRDSVSMVLQKNVLFSGTIAENLRWGDNNATDEQLVSACQMAQADEFIRGFADGYDHIVEQGGSNLSGGQKQRLCIARALLKKPKILILDDSTSAVDTATDAKIQKALAEYIPETTKIIIAQRVSSVAHADMIVVMENGEIDSVGTHDELLKNCAIYREVYESQQKGGDDE